MSGEQFSASLVKLKELQFREEFESALFGLYAACDPAQCRQLREAWRRGEFGPARPWRNPTDYDRADLTPERQPWEGLIRTSLIDESADYRDDLIGIAISYHQLRVTGRDADTILLQIADRSGPAPAALLRGFVNRKPQDKSADAFGLVIQTTPRGPVVRVQV